MLKSKTVDVRASAFLVALIGLTLLGVTPRALPVTYPNPKLTPGTVLKAITVKDICTAGYAEAVRPAGGEWIELKDEMYARYGMLNRTKFGHAADHYIPIELGGAPRDLRNLWPQPHDEALKKDYFENALHILVCTGRMSLPEAWHRILHWPTALDGVKLTPADKAQLQRYSEMDSY